MLDIAHTMVMHKAANILNNAKINEDDRAFIDALLCRMVEAEKKVDELEAEIKYKL